MRTRTISLALLAAFVLSACGGGDKSDKLPVTGAAATSVKAAATSVITDAKTSCSLLTDTALSTFTGGKTGEAGRAQCQAQVDKGALPKTATVVVLEVKGKNASVGYSTTDVTGAMQLVKGDAGWQVDGITTVLKP